MMNNKKEKFDKKVNSLSKNKFGQENVLSADLTDSVGSLSDKSKITIRLDDRIIDAAKRESELLGVGYQKIINDRLLELYSIDEAIYLREKSTSTDEKMNNILIRLEVLESKLKA